MLSLIWSDTIGKLWRRITRYNRCKKALLEMPYDERVDFCGKNYLPHNKRFRELDKAYNDIKNDECLVLNQLLKKGLVIVKNKKDGEMLAFWYDQYIYYFDFIDNKRKTKGSK